MKIVFLQDDFPPHSLGGAGFSTFELAIGMKKAGHEVFVITTCRKGGAAGESQYEGLKVFTICSDYHERWRAWVSLRNPRAVPEVKKILKQIQPDVVHANNIHYHLSYASLKVAKRYAKVVVWTARDAMAFSYGKLDTKKYLDTFDARLTWRDHIRQAGKRYNPLRNFFIRKYLRCADARFAVSNALRKALEQNGVLDVQTLHTGMDTEEWKVSREVVAHCRKKFGLEGKKVVLFGGRLNAGVQAVRAMKLVVQAKPAVLLVMGKGEGAARMKSESSGLEVVFTGWISGQEKAAAYHASDVVWVPSAYFDAFPRSVLEAMATGKPVVGTCFGGASEVIVDGVTGYVINPLHPEEIADKTLDLLKSPEKAEAFGKAGLEQVKSEFNLTNKVGEYVAFYKKLLARSPESSS